MTTTADRIRRIIADHFEIDIATVTDTATFDSFGGDSLDSVEIVLELELAFDIEVPDDVAVDLDTVGAVIKHIEEQLASESEYFHTPTDSNAGRA